MTRGIRNHNPGNIRSGAPWQGLDKPASDGEFCRFINPTWGIRAIARTLITYQDVHGINTVQRIVSRWAPSAENDTESYVRHVSDRLGVKSNKHLDVHDYTVMRPLVEAIILHENGQQPYSGAQIDKGLVLAGIEPPRKSLQASRTVKGGQVASVGVVGAALSDIASQVAPLADYSEIIKWVFLGLTLTGVALTVWARIDDHNRGLR